MSFPQSNVISYSVQCTCIERILSALASLSYKLYKNISACDKWRSISSVIDGESEVSDILSHVYHLALRDVEGVISKHMVDMAHKEKQLRKSLQS